MPEDPQAAASQADIARADATQQAQDPLAAWAAGQPDHVAVIEGAEQTSYAEFNAEVNRLCSGLTVLGSVKAGGRAVWCGPNSLEVLVFMHACRKLGLVAIPMSYRFTADEMRHVLADSGAGLVVVDSSHAETVVPLAAEVDSVATVIVYRGIEGIQGGTAGVDGGVVRSWSDVVDLGTAQEPPPPADYGAAMMYTAGTTGRPKGAIRTRSDRSLLGAMMAKLHFGAGEVHLLTGPLYHAGPNAFALLTHITGGTIVVMKAFDPAEWVRLVTRHRITSTFAAPTHLKRIVSLDYDVLGAGDFSSLRTLIANAAPVPYPLKQEVITKLGADFLYEVYGATELGIVAILSPDEQLTKPGSCGRAYGSIGLRVVGDDGAEMPSGEPGELYVHTALAIDGYNSGDPIDELPGDWISVGDVAWLDDEGYVHICDRKSDLIITGGMNVYPAEVEAVIHAHPDVLDAAVFGVPDDEWGERVHAVVAPRPGHEVDLDSLEGSLAASLADFKRPRSWDVRAELPRTESGKLLKRLLRDEFLAHS